MREKLQKLSGEELEIMAGEILRALSAAGVKPVTESRQENEALLRGMLRMSESISRAARPGDPETETVTVRENAPAETASPEQLPPQTETVYFRESSTPAALQPDAEALSELFRRDSRRYDGGFERF